MKAATASSQRPSERNWYLVLSDSGRSLGVGLAAEKLHAPAHRVRGSACLRPHRPTASAAEACPNEALRSKNDSAELPDCHAYEQVTPPFKGAGPVPA